MRSNISIISILLLTFTCGLNAQEKELHTLSAYLSESVSENKVRFAAIKNEVSGEITLSNTDGLFTIQGSVGDTLRFHSLGYKDTTWVIPTVWVNMHETIQLNVQSNIYSLSEVEVLRYRSYAHFKQAFKDLRVDKTEAEKAKDIFISWKDEINLAAAMGYAERKSGGGISIDIKSQDERKREEVKRLENIREKSTRFNYFVSRDNMLQLTEYKGTCLDSFMVFLNTGYNLHYKMDEYQLLESILQASNDFKAKYGEKDWYSQPID